MAVHARRLSALAAAFLFAVLAASGGAGARLNGRSSVSVLPTLYVSYAMNCTFGITDDSGKTVTSIPPGTYQVQITTPVVFANVDLSGTFDMTACKSFVQFQLSGPGVSIATTLQEGDEDYGVFTETFQAGATYTAQDNNQPSVARAVITVTPSGTAPAPTAPYTGAGTGKGTAQSGLIGSRSKSVTSTTGPLRGALAATISPTGKPTLTFKGNGVTTLKAGLYTISVVDRSTSGGFIIQEAKRDAITATGVSFVGRRTVTIDMTAGQWFFYPTFVGAKNYFVVSN